MILKHLYKNAMHLVYAALYSLMNAETKEQSLVHCKACNVLQYKLKLSYSHRQYNKLMTKKALHWALITAGNANLQEELVRCFA